MEVYLVEVVELIDNKLNDRYISSVHTKEESAKMEKKEILKEGHPEIDIYVNIIPMELLD